MAKLIEAMREYSPKTDLNPTLSMDQLTEFMTMRTGLTTGQMLMVLHELQDAICYFNCQGTPVKLPGLGRFAPSIDRYGSFRINVLIDKELRKMINKPGRYSGRLINEQNIGLDDAGYKVLWDADHPDDPLEL
jgi:hypothetical protein